MKASAYGLGADRGEAWRSSGACLTVAAFADLPPLVAKVTCAACPGRTACRDWAVAHRREITGVWGGLTGHERARLAQGIQERPCGACRLPMVPTKPDAIRCPRCHNHDRAVPGAPPARTRRSPRPTPVATAPIAGVYRRRWLVRQYEAIQAERPDLGPTAIARQLGVSRDALNAALRQARTSKPTAVDRVIGPAATTRKTTAIESVTSRKDPAMTATVNTERLRQALAASALFADDADMGHPALSAVYIQAGGGVLTATATSRHTLGHARAGHADGGLPGRGHLIGVRWINTLVTALDHADSRDTVTLSVVGDASTRLRVAHPDFVIEVPIRRLTPDDYTAVGITEPWVDYPKLFASFNTPTPLNAPILLSPYLLPQIAKLGELYPDRALRWTFTDPEKPARFEIGASFTGLIMPRKPSSEDLRDGTVPVGIPTTEPVAVPA